MRKLVLLGIVAMVFGFTACQKSEETPAPPSAAASAEASPAGAPSTEASPAASAEGMEASPAASPAAP
jgi:zona occludens toxin (predicted ATPase)